jgi:phosphoribosylglycinamide formyltransferase-1
MTTKNAKNVVVLISGRGSNLEAILKAAAAERWDRSPGAHVVAVISNRADAEGLAIARAFGVPTQVVAHSDHASREAFDAALAAAIDAHSPALVVLAGFMRVLTPSFVSRYAGRLINIHPSLLPMFPGLNTHRRALEAGVRVHGATVHFVSPAVDSGVIIAQAAVAVHPRDDEASLAARVLEQEHRLLPRAVRLVLEGRARCEGAKVVLHDVEPGELSLLAS